MAVLLLPLMVMAQKKEVSLDKLGLFSPKSIDGLASMNDGEHYTIIGENGRTIEKYEYATGKKVGDILNLDKIDSCKIDIIEGYIFNSNETRILLYTKSERIYRHSFRAYYYVYDMHAYELKPLSTKGKQQIATFSPDGDMVAFVRNNNLNIAKLRFGTESEITTDGEFNKIINGMPDWVYEEEFTINQAYAWSPDSKELAYIRFDESQVKEYSFPEYNGSFPAHTNNALYPGTYNYKYPKAGEANSKVSVKVFNILDRVTKTMNTDNETDVYIPRLVWTTEPGKLGIIKLNRIQNQLDLLIANTATTLSNSIFTHRNDYYISEEAVNNLTILPDGSGFVYVGEMDGYNHIHLYSMAGRKLAQITKGNFDVTEFLGYDPAKKQIYYQAAANSPLQREIYVVGIDGKSTKCLSTETGTNVASFSAGFKYMINTFSSSKTPTTITLYDSKGKQIRVLEDNKQLRDNIAQFEIAPKEFITIPVTDKVNLNAWMVKPVNFETLTKYPILIVQYSGPNSQEVTDSYEIGWEQYLASQGVIVVSVDPRGTDARGEAFRKCTYMKLGVTESDDIAATAQYLASLKYIDGSRIGIWGWSYGGYMSLLCMSKSSLFKVGIAVAPVTNWRFYDSVYTERFMRRPVENASGYDDNSPINLADKLSGKLLLIHGTADDNVHFQNSMEYADKLVQAGKQFDMQVYPNRNHSIYGGNTRNHLYERMANFILNNL
jgi:dipeptidyl-peptidase-4